MAARAKKSGDARATEVKLEGKYDEEEKKGTPKRVTEWLAKILQGKIAPCRGSSWEAIQTYLKNGVILCLLVNKLLDAVGKPPVSFKTKANITFVALANLECFIEGCKAYGVPENGLFLAHDLYEGRKATMLNVINCLNSLGVMANKNGFEPSFEAYEPPKME